MLVLGVTAERQSLRLAEAAKCMTISFSPFLFSISHPPLSIHASTFLGSEIFTTQRICMCTQTITAQVSLDDLTKVYVSVLNIHIMTPWDAFPS